MGTAWSDGNWGRQKRASVPVAARRNTTVTITTPSQPEDDTEAGGQKWSEGDRRERQ